MTRKHIALMAGGFTGEFDVSINSAANIAASLSPARYRVFTIVVTPKSWYYDDASGTRTEINKNDFSLALGEEVIHFDAAFITVHGTPGEDGKLQGYFDLIGIPYTTCDTCTASVTMNKAFTKTLVAGINGLNVAQSVRLFKHELEQAELLTRFLHYPLFIKPNNGGSSVGMSKITRPDELLPALEKAFHEDEQVLIEEFIRGREFSIGAYKFHQRISVLPPTEIISSKEFFDYEAKYTPGMSTEVTPADLPEEQTAAIGTIITQVYHLLNCKGMTRVDFILQEGTGRFYFIEINTTPGQSAASIYPQQVSAAGMDIGEFYGELIEEALR